MKIIQRKVDDLIFAEYNPRQMTQEQHKQLKDSISRFGMVDPIIVNMHEDRMNIVVGGHQRLRVAKMESIKEVPTVEVKLKYDKERELNVRLNKNTGEWNWDELGNNFDIEELKDWGFDESQLVGFSDLDYSVLNDGAVDDEMEEMLNGTRKAIQIEFKLDDYEKAYEMIAELREKDVYIGGLIMDSLNAFETDKS